LLFSAVPEDTTTRAPPGFAFSPRAVLLLTSSTRRFLARPSSLSFEANAQRGPNPARSAARRQSGISRSRPWPRRRRAGAKGSGCSPKCPHCRCASQVSRLWVCMDSSFIRQLQIFKCPQYTRAVRRGQGELSRIWNWKPGTASPVFRPPCPGPLNHCRRSSVWVGSSRSCAPCQHATTQMILSSQR